VRNFVFFVVDFLLQNSERSPIFTIDFRLNLKVSVGEVVSLWGEIESNSDMIDGRINHFYSQLADLGNVIDIHLFSQ